MKNPLPHAMLIVAMAACTPAPSAEPSGAASTATAQTTPTASEPPPTCPGGGPCGMGMGPGPRAGRGPMGPGARGPGAGSDPERADDMATFRYLLDHHANVRRTVDKLPNGIVAVTETDDDALRDKLREHIAKMYTRMDEKRPIRLRDPLFRALFAHADAVASKVENTERGVRVTVTSDDPEVVKLIQAHADVVSGFVEHGHSEARKNHPVPQ